MPFQLVSKQIFLKYSHFNWTFNKWKESNQNYYVLLFNYSFVTVDPNRNADSKT